MTREGIVGMVLVLILSVAVTVPAWAQERVSEHLAIEVDVSAEWQGTGVMLGLGELTLIYAKGLYAITDQMPPGPGSWQYWWGPSGQQVSSNSSFLAPGLSRHCLIARIGETGEPFAIGEFRYFVAETAGELFLAVNDQESTTNHGALYAFLWGPWPAGAVLDGDHRWITDRLGLQESRPNPFDGRTAISYAVPIDGFVEVSILDTQGRVQRVLLSERTTAGTYATEWDGRDEVGNQLASGAYYCRVAVDGTSSANKLILLR
ncbi:FlgD immunoglobulin-like domain containing protein [Candidatus Eisenbacteria bacterium]|uniref:FlgD immunoglobulin-like domain containing protein n=1 Tax=Eiseniibacteriota bacterium TaxID=2212470 RepID=A0ABV6YJZ1_UNCEI